MNYHPDDFLALLEEVEKQGGAHLNEVCKPTVFRLNLPIDWDNPRGPKRSEKIATTGCRRRTKFLVSMLPEAYFSQVNPVEDTKIASYDRQGNRSTRPAQTTDFDFDDSENPMARMSDGTPALTKVCAVDDSIALWPRFKDTLHTGASFPSGPFMDPIE